MLAKRNAEEEAERLATREEKTASLLFALQKLLEGLGLPVYAEGRVPDGAVYPYLVWGRTLEGFGQKGSAQVCGWFRSDYAACIRLVDMLCAMLPEQGVLLGFEGGKALLWCEEAYGKTDAADTSVTGGCVRLGVKCYTAGDIKEVTP